MLAKEDYKIPVSIVCHINIERTAENEQEGRTLVVELAILWTCIWQSPAQL